MKDTLSNKKLLLATEQELVKYLDFPLEGGRRGRGVLITAYGTLDNILKAPALMALGARGMGPEVRQGVYEFLKDEGNRKRIQELVDRRNALRPEPPFELFSMGLFDWQPVLWELLGTQFRGQMMAIVLKRWQKSVMPLKDALIRRETINSKLRDEHHWELMRLMKDGTRCDLANSLDEFRYLFRIKKY